MTFCRVGTCGTSVVFVKTEAMSPAVEHMSAVVGNGRTWGGDMRWRGRE